MRPIIKYTGGKYREFPYFKPYIPQRFQTYYEPFLGGGATFFNLEPKHAYLGDVNARLIHFYRDLRANYPAVRRELVAIHARYMANVACNKQQYAKYHYVYHDKNKAFYYQMRKMFNGLAPMKYHYATVYYCVDKLAFGGMIRYNRSGQFNVPFGRYMSFSIANVDSAHVRLLRHAQLRCEPYLHSFKRAGRDDFMFLDPPYDSAFTNYGNGRRFGVAQQKQLAERFKRLRCHALLIIASTPLIRKLYHGYIRDSYGKTYSINIKNRFQSAKHAQHLIITNY